MKYFIIWIEGLYWRRGEKIHLMGQTDHTYTTLITKSLRIKKHHIEAARKRLEERGVPPNLIKFIPTTYAPAGTIWKP